MRRALVVLAFDVMVVTACRSRERVQADPVTSAPRPSSSHAEPIIPPFEPTATPRDDDLQVFLTKTEVRVGSVEVMPMPSPADGATSGLGVRFKPVAPLKKAVDAYFAGIADDADGDRAALVAADGGTPYRVLVDVLFTLGHAGVTKYHLVLLMNAKTPARKYAADLPAMTLHASAASLNLSLVVVADGVSFETAAGVLGTGCNKGASGVTIPRLAGALDLDGVRRCAQKLKSGAADETFVLIAATSATPYVEIIAVMDAVRTDGHVDLFPAVAFGAPR